MSYYFNGTTSIISRFSGASATAVPLSMMCWFNPVTDQPTQTLMGLSQFISAIDRNCFELNLFGELDGDPAVQASTGAPTNNNAANSTLSYALNIWQHAAAIFTSATDRAAYYNGGFRGVQTTSRVPSGVNRFCIGASLHSSAISTPYNGKLAEVALWNCALSPGEVRGAASGKPHGLIRPESLLLYLPLRCGGYA